MGGAPIWAAELLNVADQLNEITRTAP